MVGQAFEFQGHSPQDLAANRNLAASECFDCLRVGRRMADRCVACERLHVMDRPFVRSAAHRPFDAAVLVAQGDFQVEHVFAVALKAKMAWFNHPGMYRANGDFMDFFAIDTIKIHDSRHGLALRFRRDAKHHVPVGTKRGTAPA